MTEPAKKAKELTVYVGGAPYTAVIDDSGDLRFKRNWALAAVNDAAEQAGISVAAELAERFAWVEPRPSIRAYAEYLMLMGCPVEEFCELEVFKRLEVSTPQWRREGSRPWAPKRRRPRRPTAPKASGAP